MDDMVIRIENDLPIIGAEITARIMELERMATEIEAKQKELRERLLKEMESRNIVKIENDFLTITYVAQSDREKFDSKAFRKAHPDLYDEYVKMTTSSSYVKVNVKGGQ